MNAINRICSNTPKLNIKLKLLDFDKRTRYRVLASNITLLNTNEYDKTATQNRNASIAAK